MMTIKEIEEQLKNTPIDILSDEMTKFDQDERASVKKILAKYQKKLDQYALEKERLKKMLVWEEKYKDYPYICGIDEAGRGPYAGPVVAAAVILPKGLTIPYLNDSKQLSEKRREELFDIIMEKAVSVGVGMAGPDRIDEINILQADYEAMREAVGKLSHTPDVLLNDAVIIPDMPQTMIQEKIIHGDANSLSIAAASIIAKVTRDRLMTEYDQIFPEYGFAKHKGYGSKAHEEAIRTYGLCPIHRRSFTKKFETET